jgi:SAM-dependent methyltransferase
MGPNSLLRAPQLARAERYCLNLVDMPSRDGITSVKGNANRLDAFEDGWFDLVMSNATLEHDKHFWLSLAEMKRVLRPGGLLIIGVPGYVKDPAREQGKSTLTYRVHYKFDYYRFSEQAVREVFFDAMDDVVVTAIMTPPRIVGHGWKPGGERPVPPPAPWRRLASRLRKRARGGSRRRQ